MELDSDGDSMCTGPFAPEYMAAQRKKLKPDTLVRCGQNQKTYKLSQLPVSKKFSAPPESTQCPWCGTNINNVDRNLKKHCRAEIKIESKKVTVPKCLKSKEKSLLFNSVPELNSWLAEEKEKKREWVKTDAQKSNEKKETKKSGGDKDSFFLELRCSRSHKKREKRQNSSVKAPRRSSASKHAGCRAFITVTKCGEFFTVRRFGQHTHKLDIKHLTHSQETENNVARQIRAGVSNQRIMDMHNKAHWHDYSANGKNMSRDDFLTMQFIQNLRKKMGVSNSGQRARDDVTAVELLKRELDNTAMSHGHESYFRFWKRNTERVGKLGNGQEAYQRKIFNRMIKKKKKKKKDDTEQKEEWEAEEEWAMMFATERQLDIYAKHVSTLLRVFKK